MQVSNSFSKFLDLPARLCLLVNQTGWRQRLFGQHDELSHKFTSSRTLQVESNALVLCAWLTDQQKPGLIDKKRKAQCDELQWQY
eukprot:2779813-Rhodomonas_salina.1